MLVLFWVSIFSTVFSKCILKKHLVESNLNPDPIENNENPDSIDNSNNGGQQGYSTYHNYYAFHSMLTPACSDGTYGLNTRWEYTTLAPMYPYVTAYSNVHWNHPDCGNCVKLTHNSTTIYVTIIDQVGGPLNTHHFDLAPEAFEELFGNQGIQDGHGYMTWEFVASSNCKGNLG